MKITVVNVPVVTHFSRETYNHVTSWLSDARSLANKDIAIILVGNKADLPNREVTFLEASRFAQENGFPHLSSLLLFTFYLSPPSLFTSFSLHLTACSISALSYTNYYAELMFIETSALSGEGVEQVFFQCARSILSKIQSGKF